MAPSAVRRAPHRARCRATRSCRPRFPPDVQAKARRPRALQIFLFRSGQQGANVARAQTAHCFAILTNVLRLAALAQLRGHFDRMRMGGLPDLPGDLRAALGVFVVGRAFERVGLLCMRTHIMRAVERLENLASRRPRHTGLPIGVADIPLREGFVHIRLKGVLFHANDIVTGHAGQGVSEYREFLRVIR
ncbi:Ribonucleases P/MRP protein subunit POP1 [Paraburkholderia tropica]|nr:Ribonucleases P/MRP protein subunit POP1 [Paraburkholderia tropica]